MFVKGMNEKGRDLNPSLLTLCLVLISLSLSLSHTHTHTHTHTEPKTAKAMNALALGTRAHMCFPADCISPWTDRPFFSPPVERLLIPSC